MVGRMCPVLAAVYLQAPAADFLTVEAVMGTGAGSEDAAAAAGPEHAVVGTWGAERSRFLIPSGE